MTADHTIHTTLPKATSWTINLNTIAAGTLAGLASGAIAGLLARLAMRVVTLIAGQRPEFNLMATVAIVILFALMGLTFGLLYLAGRRVMPAPDAWRSVVFGVVLAGLTAWPFFRSSNGELGIVTPWIGAALFAPISLIYRFRCCKYPCGGKNDGGTHWMGWCDSHDSRRAVGLLSLLVVRCGRRRAIAHVV